MSVQNLFAMQKVIFLLVIFVFFLSLPVNCQEKFACGRKQNEIVQQYVSFGEAVDDGQYPWHAGLYFNNTKKELSLQCGGTLLNERIVISAAHCLYQYDSNIPMHKFLILLGTSLSDTTKLGRKKYARLIPLRDFKTNGDYNSLDHSNDIALLRLSESVEFNNFIRPICLTSERFIQDSEDNEVTGFVSGWGYGQTQTALAEVLHEAPMTTKDDSVCIRDNEAFFKLHLNKKNFCAGNKNGTTVCRGDSGGGLVFQFDNGWFLGGLVSIGPGVAYAGRVVCNLNSYVIFTDVVEMFGWIKSQYDEEYYILLPKGRTRYDEALAPIPETTSKRTQWVG